MKGDLDIISCGCRPVPEPWFVDMTHRINRLYFVHSGTGWYEQRGKKTYFEAGKAYFIPYTTDALQYSDKQDKLVITWCDFRLSLPIMSKIVCAFEVGDDAMLKAAIAVFHEGGKRNGTALNEKPAKEFEKLYLHAVRYLVDYAAKCGSVTQVRDEPLVRAIEEMHERLDEKISVRELAEECFLSEDGFIRRFTKKTGITPYAYLKELRIRTAILLRAEGFTLDEIASRVGYADASSLLHAVGNRTGQYPKPFQTNETGE